MKKKEDSTWFEISDEDEIPFGVSDEKEQSIYPLKEDRNILDDPRLIQAYLEERIYGQSAATKECAIFTFNSLKGHNAKSKCMALVGPTGSGKTYIFECLSELLEKEKSSTKMVCVDCASISPTGYVGESACSFLYDLEEDTNYIVFLDEFDKIIQKAKRNNGFYASVLNEYLVLMQPAKKYIRLHPSNEHPGVNKRIKIGGFTWVICGAFSELADRISEKTKTSTIGFGVVNTQEEAYSKKLTLEDIIDYGMPPELAGRIGKVVNVRPIEKEKYYELIVGGNNSPINILEEIYELPKDFIREQILSDDMITDLVDECFAKKLGVRYVYVRIQKIIDDYLYDNFDQYYKLMEVNKKKRKKKVNVVSATDTSSLFDSDNKCRIHRKISFSPSYAFPDYFDEEFTYSMSCNNDPDGTEKLKAMHVNFASTFTVGALDQYDEDFMQMISADEKEMDMYKFIEHLVNLAWSYYEFINGNG